MKRCFLKLIIIIIILPRQRLKWKPARSIWVGTRDDDEDDEEDVLGVAGRES